MALVVNDRVRETSTTTGTGTLTLAGAITGFETFSTAIGNTNTTYYSIVNENGEFEVGLGTVGAGTLSRDTIISSSNSDAAVNFSAGTKDVFCTLPASKAVILDSSGNIVANNGSNLTNLNADNLASGTVPDARFPATLPAADGSNLTALNATQLTSGTVPDARFPATLPAISGANLTNLDASDLASGTVPDARFPATLPAISGANLTNLDADDLASGTVPDARFPATLPAISGANLTSLNATNIASGTLASDRLPTVPTTKGGTGLTTIGTANQVLAVNGAGTALEYQTPTTGDITGVTAGNGLTGGGTSGDVTLNVGAGALIDVTADAIDVDLSELTTSTSDADGDFFVVVDSVNAQKKLTKANINISGFNNDSGFTTNTGTVTSVSGGNGLTGTVTTSGSLAVGEGTGIDVAADSISVDVSDFMSNGSNNRVLTATGTDAMNAEANLTFDGTNLGIGTASPSRTLEVSGSGARIYITAANEDISMDSSGNGQISIDGVGYQAGIALDADAMNIYTNSASRDVVLGVNETEILRAKPAGVDVTGTLVTDKGYIAETTLTDGATISWNMNTQSVAKVTLGGNRTIAAPTNGSTGQFASLLVIQDGTGSRTLTWNAVYEFASDTAPTLSTTGGKADLFVFRYNGTKWLEVGRNLLLTVS